MFVKFTIWCLTENLALHQPAWQSGTFLSYTADRAVDGRSPACVMSKPERTAEWWVYLRGVKNIHQVLIQYDTGNSVLLLFNIVSVIKTRDILMLFSVNTCFTRIHYMLTNVIIHVIECWSVQFTIVYISVVLLLLTSWIPKIRLKIDPT